MPSDLNLGSCAWARSWAWIAAAWAACRLSFCGTKSWLGCTGASAVDEITVSVAAGGTLGICTLLWFAEVSRTVWHRSTGGCASVTSAGWLPLVCPEANALLLLPLVRSIGTSSSNTWAAAGAGMAGGQPGLWEPAVGLLAGGMAGMRDGIGCRLGLGVGEAWESGEAVLQLRGPGGDWAGDPGDETAVPVGNVLAPSMDLAGEATVAAGEGWPIEEEPGREGGTESGVGGGVATGVFCLASAISLCISWGGTTVTTECIFSSTTPPDQPFCFLFFPPLSPVGPGGWIMPATTWGTLPRLPRPFLLLVLWVGLSDASFCVMKVGTVAPDRGRGLGGLKDWLLGRNSLALAGILDSSFISSSRKDPPRGKRGCGGGHELVGAVCDFELAGLRDMPAAVDVGGGGGLTGAVGILCLECGRAGAEVDATVQTGADGGGMGKASCPDGEAVASGAALGALPESLTEMTCLAFASFNTPGCNLVAAASAGDTPGCPFRNFSIRSAETGPGAMLPWNWDGAFSRLGAAPGTDGLNNGAPRPTPLAVMAFSAAIMARACWGLGLSPLPWLPAPVLAALGCWDSCAIISCWKNIMFFLVMASSRSFSSCSFWFTHFSLSARALSCSLLPEPGNSALDGVSVLPCSELVSAASFAAWMAGVWALLKLAPTSAFGCGFSGLGPSGWYTGGGSDIFRGAFSCCSKALVSAGLGTLETDVCWASSALWVPLATMLLALEAAGLIAVSPAGSCAEALLDSEMAVDISASSDMDFDCSMFGWRSNSALARLTAERRWRLEGGDTRESETEVGSNAGCKAVTSVTATDGRAFSVFSSRHFLALFMIPCMVFLLPASTARTPRRALCLSMCSSKTFSRLNSLEQTVQKKGRLPMCSRTWAANSFFLVNFLPHSWQVSTLEPRWRSRWSARLFFNANFCPQ